MYTRNSDTGKWFNQKDTLKKDYYDSLKQDLDKVRLYSKCLSGATYLPINSLDNIYDVLDIDKVGYYVRVGGGAINAPLNGPALPLNASNSNEFYNKYLKENAFTLKNLFTPNKLIDDQLDNYLYVDVASISELNNIGQVDTNLTIDGIKLLEGHRVLIKDQKSEVTLASNVDPDDYFLNFELTSSYDLVSDNVTSKVYSFYNNQNGVYLYTNNKLVITTDLDLYEDAYRYSVCVKMGGVNRERQFHLKRLNNGYYPLISEGQNVEFEEKHNWILRNRVDYNNIYDINYYDIINHSTQSVYIELDSRTYSIPSRTIAVGEFGVIINNQDIISSSSTHSNSTIISNKYKVNIKSIYEVEKYYWVCGDEGTLLRINKHDFSIKRIELNETSNLTSISFYGNLNGIVVGKFNTIYWTNNGGDSWNKLEYPNFDIYSYNKVTHIDFSKAYIGGEAGVFIELNYSTGAWIAYKRKVSKKLDSIDEYILVEDINDMSKTDWTVLISSTASKDQAINDFAYNLVYNNSSYNSYGIEIDIDSKYYGDSVFNTSQFFIALEIIDSDSNIVYSNPLYANNTPIPLSFQTYDFYKYIGITTPGTQVFKDLFTTSLSIDDKGNLKNTTYTINAKLFYNYSNGVVLPSYIYTTYSYDVKTINGKILLISTNNDNIITYDVNNIISNESFIYFSSTQSHSDIKTISRRPTDSSVYIGGDKIYSVDFSNIININNGINVSSGTSSIVKDFYINKLYLTNDNIYISGNNSLLKSDDYINLDFNDLDPSFNDSIKSRFLFLDYDVASKLNFFTDGGDYRLANSVTFSSSSFTSSFVIKNISGEKNWLNYYKDAEKTFAYNSSISDSDKIEFSSTFSSTGGARTGTSINSSEISISVSDILPLAPNITSSSASRFIEDIPISMTFSTSYRALINKYLIIFKTNLPIDEGDVINLTSDVIDCNLVVNRIERYITNTFVSSLGIRQLFWPVVLGPGQVLSTYVYCYSDFNDNIIRNLKNSGFTINNLNKFIDIPDLLTNSEIHPISIGYDLELNDGVVTVSQRFNNKTAYYNMQSTIEVGAISKDMVYEESFLNFGYSPTYNLLDYLGKINPVYFTSSTIFTILPEYYGLPGNGGNTFTQSNVYIDLSEGAQVGTYSWYRSGTNKVIFGSNYKFQWDSLLLNTFIDLDMTSTTYGQVTNERMLITKKYYDSSIDGYVMEFHKKIEVSSGIPVNSFDVNSFAFLSRNRLSQISSDLQLLNNIQRTSITKSIQLLNTFTSLENELSSKYPTDSYFKVLASDYNIRQFISGIIYTDNNYQIAMNILNLDEEKTYKILSTSQQTINGFTNKLKIDIDGTHDLIEGDLIYVEFNGGTNSSQTLNPQYFGLQTVIYALSSPGNSFVVTSNDFGVNSLIQDFGKISFLKKDAFFNYQPIDIIDYGIDKKVTRSVEILPENYDLDGSKYNLINLDLKRYRFQFVDGLSLEEVGNLYPWLLEAEISNAIIGKDINGLVWYSGTWKCGRWFGGTWYSGTWVSGDWYNGLWNSYNTIYKVIGVKIDTSFIDNTVSKWFGGRWFDGIWNGGTWYDGRRYDGDWNTGNWYNGIWNDGNWKTGNFYGGVWVLGNWESGILNCDSKPSYWLDGTFKSGDFENGIWYNGQFGNDKGLLSRFGTKSTNSRTSTWNGGKWINGEFHSYINIDSSTGIPIVSDIHKYSIWKTGIWLKGNFYGGIAYNIDFRSGVWHGGILEEIQIIGVDAILPASQSTNSITINGIFKFNIGDEIWVIDDYTGGAFSYLGNNENPMKYRINEILELEDSTKLYLNYNLSSLGVPASIATASYSDVETGLRIVSYFKDSNWKSGLWTNGIFEGGQYDSGIWYNGVFNGNWGN